MLTDDLESKVLLGKKKRGKKKPKNRKEIKLKQKERNEKTDQKLKENWRNWKKTNRPSVLGDFKNFIFSRKEKKKPKDNRKNQRK